MVDSTTENNAGSAGILYVATGQQYFDEAIASATSCRAHMPQVPIHIFTDIPTSHAVFSSMTLLSKPLRRSGDKILPLMESPYQRTVFLDTDTYACCSFEELFDLLNSFDMAGVHSPKRASYLFKNYPVPEEAREIPSAFSEWNSGVLAFRKNAATDQQFRLWHFWYMCALKRGDNGGKPHDQPSFRVALFQSQCRYHTLTSEYNCRFEQATAHCGPVKILHGRAPDLGQIARVINSDLTPRAYVQGRVLPSQPVPQQAALGAVRPQSARRPHFTQRFDLKRPLLSLAAWYLRRLLRYRVHSGPFRGLRFHKPGIGVTYYAKLLGTYEMELHPCLQELCQMPFERVANVGAGDGYYAVGLAYRMPAASLLAFEKQTTRHTLIQRLAEINHVLPRVRIAGACDPSALSAALDGSGRELVFMDVEGAEEELLDPKLVPHLRSAFIVVEIHEGAQPGIGSRIATRFASTHSLTTIPIQRRHTQDFPWKSWSRLLFSRPVRRALMNENRRDSIGWCCLRPHASK